MYFSLFVIAFLGAAAGRAIAFNITVGQQNLDVSEILNIPDSPVKTACNAYCSDSTEVITACDGVPQCLCSIDTVTSILSCEMCMFNYLIAQNQPAPDFRAGSNVVMSAYGAACKAQANIVLPANLTALMLPSTWDGPVVIVLPIGVATLYAMVGGVLGISALYILSNIE